MTYLLCFLLASPLLALAHIANVYLRQWRAERRRAREVLELELVWVMDAVEPRRQV